MEERATYQTLRDFLLGGADGNSAEEVSYAEFEACFPQKYRKSDAVKRLYEEFREERRQLRREVEAHLRREFPAGAANRNADGSGMARLRETISILKEKQQELARDHKKLVGDTADLEESFRSFETKLRSLADQDQEPREKPEVDAQGLLPLLRES